MSFPHYKSGSPRQGMVPDWPRRAGLGILQHRAWVNMSTPHGSPEIDNQAQPFGTIEAALAALDSFGESSPRVSIIDGTNGNHAFTVRGNTLLDSAGGQMAGELRPTFENTYKLTLDGDMLGSVGVAIQAGGTAPSEIVGQNAAELTFITARPEDCPPIVRDFDEIGFIEIEGDAPGVAANGGNGDAALGANGIDGADGDPPENGTAGGSGGTAGPGEHGEPGGAGYDAPSSFTLRNVTEVPQLLIRGGNGSSGGNGGNGGSARGGNGGNGGNATGVDQDAGNGGDSGGGGNSGAGGNAGAGGRGGHGCDVTLDNSHVTDLFRKGGLGNSAGMAGTQGNADAGTPGVHGNPTGSGALGFNGNNGAAGVGGGDGAAAADGDDGNAGSVTTLNGGSVDNDNDN